MFGTSKSQEIADLQAVISTLTTERDGLASAVAQHEAAITALTAERDDANARVAVAQDAARGAQAAADARIAEFEAANAARVNEEVINRLASAGADPIARDPDANAEASKELSLEEFNKLQPHQKSAFSIAGGRIR